MEDCDCCAWGGAVHWAASHKEAKKITEDVYLLYGEVLTHHCKGQNWYTKMKLREHDEGPRYWCEGCGYVLDDGVAMAIRLYEAPFS